MIWGQEKGSEKTPKTSCIKKLINLTLSTVITYFVKKKKNTGKRIKKKLQTERKYLPVTYSEYIMCSQISAIRKKQPNFLNEQKI